MSRFARIAVVLAALSGLACGQVSLSEMVPGGNVGTGELECWLTLEFSGEASGFDPTDVVVEFSGLALDEPTEFDWEYISTHDQIPQGFMKGFAQNEATQPDAAPPVDMPIKVRYPLRARRRVYVDTGEDLDLTATVYWGGKQQGSITRSLGHMYAAEGSAF